MNKNHIDSLDPNAHFQGKDALGHILEKRAQASESNFEPHGSEMPSYMTALYDSACQLAFFLALLHLILLPLNLSPYTLLLIMGLFSLGAMITFACRKAWLGWTRMERLHRILEQEKYEIEHHRPQERDELKALYQLKGFEADLLEEVVDVLMADNERLLKVMLEEEMGLSLGTYEHPLKQGLGAVIGSLIAAVTCFIATLLFSSIGVFLTALAIMGLAGGLSAYREQNRIIPAFIWNSGLGLLSLSVVYFVLKLFVD